MAEAETVGALPVLTPPTSILQKMLAVSCVISPAATSGNWNLTFSGTVEITAAELTSLSTVF